LELGPGTGVFTESLIQHGVRPERIIAVEYDTDFAERVRERCPGVNVIKGDAFDLATALSGLNGTGYAAIVSGVPLLNWPLQARQALIGDVLNRLQPRAPFVQFSYGLAPPVLPPDGFTVRRAAVIWANLPPARVWVYTSH
jgi:phosphatidylethanolamine/phosphatidyl-N-methylethanolamine N-methyltransferase